MGTAKSTEKDGPAPIRPLSRGQGRREAAQNSQPGTGPRVALLFPGQGSQASGMREVVDAHRPDLLERATSVIGSDPFERISDGTRYQQPAIYCASLAGWERAGRPGAACYAGHSLGEIAALSASGALDSTDGLMLAIRRGELMQKASEQAPGGGMMAIIGNDEATGRIAEEVGITIANFNAPGQIVVSGDRVQLTAVESRAAEAGLRAMRLAVNGAFHSPAMQPVVPEFRATLDETEIAEPVAPVLCCTTAKPFDDIRARLADALVRPVRWQETVLALETLGIEQFTETGPGKVLKNLVRRILPDAETRSLDQPEAANA